MPDDKQVQESTEPRTFFAHEVERAMNRAFAFGALFSAALGAALGSAVVALVLVIYG